MPEPTPAEVDQVGQFKRLARLGLPESVIKAMKAAKPIAPDADQWEDCQHHGKWLSNPARADGVRCVESMCPACRTQARASRLVSAAQIPPRFAECTFDNFQVVNKAQEAARQACLDYAGALGLHVHTGTSLLLMGNPGTGKNHLATAIVRAAMEVGLSALRVKAAEYLEKFWAADFDGRSKLVDKLARVDLLLVDEIGRASDSKGAQDAMFRLIDGRYEQQKPTLITTNLDKAGLTEVLGEAAYDRLRDGGGQIVRFTWESHRGRR